MNSQGAESIGIPARVGRGEEPLALDAGLLVLRLFFGLALALAHGLGKLPPSDRFITGVSEMGFPLPVVFAWVSTVAELGGGALLAVGLLARPAAMVIILNMLVAAFIRQAGDPFSEIELATTYLAAALAILLTGPGRFSLDRKLRRRRAKRICASGGWPAAVSGPSARTACPRTSGSGSESAPASTGTASGNPRCRALPLRCAGSRRVRAGANGEPRDNAPHPASSMDMRSISDGDRVPACQPSEGSLSTPNGGSPSPRAANDGSTAPENRAHLLGGLQTSPNILRLPRGRRR